MVHVVPWVNGQQHPGKQVFFYRHVVILGFIIWELHWAEDSIWYPKSVKDKYVPVFNKWNKLYGIWKKYFSNVNELKRKSHFTLRKNNGSKTQ